MASVSVAQLYFSRLIQVVWKSYHINHSLVWQGNCCLFTVSILKSNQIGYLEKESKPKPVLEQNHF